MKLFFKHTVVSNLLAQVLIFLSVLGLSLSCGKDEDPPENRKDISVSISEYEMTGASQSFTFEIVGDYDWKIISPDWMSVSPKEGSGTNTITVSVGDNFYEKRQGSINVYSNSKTSMVSVSQSPVFNINTEDILVRSFYGYSDSYDLYAKNIQVSLSEGVNDKKYEEMIPEIEKEQSQVLFPIKPFSDGYVFLVPGFSLNVNGKTGFADMAIYVNQSWMEEADKKDISYYQGMSRSSLISILKNSGLEHSMLASWPGRTTIRFELAMAGDNRARFYIGEPTNYNIQLPLDYSLLKYSTTNSAPVVGSKEYAMIYDRFENRQFKDNNGNVFVINVSSKRLHEINNIDLSLEGKTCPFSFNSDYTYPVVCIKKNGETFYDLVTFMYVEWLGESLNNGDECYCTGFESELAIGGEVIRIDFDSGADDDSRPWYQFQKTRLFDYSDGEFHNYEPSIIKLYPLDEGERKPLAGVGLPGGGQSSES